MLVVIEDNCNLQDENIRGIWFRDMDHNGHAAIHVFTDLNICDIIGFWILVIFYVIINFSKKYYDMRNYNIANLP